MSVQIRGSSGNIADVDSSHQLKVALPTTATSAGYVAISGEVATSSDPAGRVVLPVEVTRDSRIRTGIDQPIWQFTNEGTNAASHLLQATNSTMAAASSGTAGYLSINSALTTNNSAYSYVQSYRSFPVCASFPTFAEFRILTANATSANSTIDFGLGTISTGAAIPTDGAYFRFSTLGEFRCVVNNNGTEVASSALTAPTGNVYNKYIISWYTDRVDFWVNDALYATIPVTTTLGQITMQSAQPVFARVYNATSVSTAKSINVGLMAVSFGDQATNKPWPQVMAGAGFGAYNVPMTQATGQTANYANSAAPVAAATWSNTAAAYSTLGGQWVNPVTWPGVAETDLCVFSYLNASPASGTTTGRNLYITGVRIGETFVTGALTGGPNFFQWFIGGMGTSANLSTADSLTAVSTRRIAIGTQ